MPPIIMKCELTFRSGRTRPTHARSSGSETLLRIRSSAGSTIDMRVFSFQKRQYQRGCYSAAITLAEPICRAPHWLDPPRMFGSHHHLQRESLARCAIEVFSISSQDQNASLARQGLSAASPHTTSLRRRDYRVPRGGRLASSLRTSRRMTAGGQRRGPRKFHSFCTSRKFPMY
jgi:hypothetical protein